jgi:hypothetical protein
VSRLRCVIAHDVRFVPYVPRVLDALWATVDMPDAREDPQTTVCCWLVRIVAVLNVNA